MSEEITTGFINSWADAVRLALQERGSKLRMAVSEDMYQGEGAQVVELVGQTEARRVTSKNTPMEPANASHKIPWVYPNDYDWMDFVNSFDKLRRATDPTSQYARNAALAMGRAMDDELISAFFGTMKHGKDGSSSEAFDTSKYQIPVNEGGSNSNLTVEKLRATREAMRGSHVELEFENLWVGIGSSQERSLLSESEYINLDYDERPVLANGQLKSFLGFNFIVSERFDTDSNGYRRVPIWAESGMHLGVWMDLNPNIHQREDLRGRPFQIDLMGTFGATRVEQGKVIEVLCDETA